MKLSLFALARQNQAAARVPDLGDAKEAADERCELASLRLSSANTTDALHEDNDDSIRTVLT
jgi:hypothetical protein